MSANNTQVGGDHYKRGGEEHWDRIWRLYGRGYFVGCITKYVERYHLKNGVQDLEKARHFITKLIELEVGIAAPRADPGMMIANPETINPTGWRDFVFEGISAEGQLMTCRFCKTRISVPPFSNPYTAHLCGAEPSPSYVNQD